MAVNDMPIKKVIYYRELEREGESIRQAKTREIKKTLQSEQVEMGLLKICHPDLEK